MPQIPLTKGYFAIVDDDDFEALSQYKWHVSKSKNKLYAHRKVFVSGNRWTSIKMHRQILDAKNPKIPIDHVDGNGLNNQKSNLRFCSVSENAMNSDKKKSNTSGYKGVSFNNSVKKYEAYITVNNKRKHLGLFDCPKEAAKAYDLAAIYMHKDFAKPNFPIVESAAKILHHAKQTV